MTLANTQCIKYLQPKLINFRQSFRTRNGVDVLHYPCWNELIAFFFFIATNVSFKIYTHRAQRWQCFSCSCEWSVDIMPSKKSEISSSVSKHAEYSTENESIHVIDNVVVENEKKMMMKSFPPILTRLPNVDKYQHRIIVSRFINI